MTSSKSDKFKELAQTRVNKALKAIELIGNLSETKNYDYDEAQVKKIFSHLESALDTSKRRFQDKLKKNKKNEFTL
jgi:uncharacterized protein Yka (UPF0111/DUF47 family)